MMYLDNVVSLVTLNIFAMCATTGVIMTIKIRFKSHSVAFKIQVNIPEKIKATAKISMAKLI